MQHENESDDVIANDAIEQAYQSQKQINKSEAFFVSLLLQRCPFRMLELELEQCRTSYQREYQRTSERLTQVEQENLDLCKSIDENTVDDAVKQQISSVINENLVGSSPLHASLIASLPKELHQQIQTNHAEIRKLRRVIKLVNKSFSAGELVSLWVSSSLSFQAMSRGNKCCRTGRSILPSRRQRWVRDRRAVRFRAVICVDRVPDISRGWSNAIRKKRNASPTPWSSVSAAKKDKELSSSATDFRIETSSGREVHSRLAGLYPLHVHSVHRFRRWRGTRRRIPLCRDEENQKTAPSKRSSPFSFDERPLSLLSRETKISTIRSSGRRTPWDSSMFSNSTAVKR